MEARQQQRNLGRAFLTTSWLFQLIAAGPIFVWLGLAAIFNLFYTFDRAYDFITHLCTSLLAASIFFIVLIQRKLSDGADGPLTLRFEISKSVCATALWVWLILDAIFGPEDHYGYREGRRTRVTAAAVSIILLLCVSLRAMLFKLLSADLYLVSVLFYPTVVLALRNADIALWSDGLEEAGERGEEAPLLRDSRSESA